MSYNPTLKAWWRFDESSGVVASDSSGNGNDGAITGAVRVAGKYGKALSFNGTSDYVDVPYSASLDNFDELTVSAWIYPIANPAVAYPSVVTKAAGAVGGFVLYFYTVNNTIQFMIQDSVGAIYATPIVIPAFNIWYHVVATYKRNATLNLYVNGVPSTPTVATRDERLTLNAPVRISNLDSWDLWKGVIDDVHIYNRVLSLAEIQALYAGTTLDGQPLTVTKWGENVQTVASQYDAWVSGAYKRKVKVYGIIRTYMIDCVEQAIDWVNSLANNFEDKASTGLPLVFSSLQAVRIVDSVSAYVLNVSSTLENIGGQNIRKFTLTLQEA